jgi:hypothetical protein
MEPNYDAWPTNDAPAGFAERTVNAILAAERTTPLPVRRRWAKPVGVFLLAAFFAGGAWAAYEYSQEPAGTLAVDSDAEPAAVARPVTVHVGQPQHALAESPVPRPERQQLRPSEPATEPTPPQKLIPPPPPSCDCGPGAIVCTCRSGSPRERQTP